MSDQETNRIDKHDIPHVTTNHNRFEQCTMCDNIATHKVGEEIPSPPSELYYNMLNFNSVERFKYIRHNFTAYVCCECFCKIFGWLPRKHFCKLGEEYK